MRQPLSYVITNKCTSIALSISTIVLADVDNVEAKENDDESGNENAVSDDDNKPELMQVDGW